MTRVLARKLVDLITASDGEPTAILKKHGFDADKSKAAKKTYRAVDNRPYHKKGNFGPATKVHNELIKNGWKHKEVPSNYVRGKHDDHYTHPTHGKITHERSWEGHRSNSFVHNPKRNPKVVGGIANNLHEHLHGAGFKHKESTSKSEGNITYSRRGVIYDGDHPVASRSVKTTTTHTFHHKDPEARKSVHKELTGMGFTHSKGYLDKRSKEAGHTSTHYAKGNHYVSIHTKKTGTTITHTHEGSAPDRDFNSREKRLSGYTPLPGSKGKLWH